MCGYFSTHLSQMEFSIRINETSLFLGFLVGIFPFNSNFNRTSCKQNSGDPDQMSHYEASDLDLHCLSMSHKKMLCLYGLNRLIETVLLSIHNTFLYDICKKNNSDTNFMSTGLNIISSKLHAIRV